MILSLQGQNKIFTGASIIVILLWEEKDMSSANTNLNRQKKIQPGLRHNKCKYTL